MRLTTPAGMSASSHAFTSSTADSDVKLAGFSTAQLPAAIAGAIFQPAMRSGKFHGTMPVHTPYGSRRTMLFAGGNGLSPRSITSGSFSAQPAKYSNVRRAAGHVGEHRLLDRAAAVARFDLGDLARARGDQLGDLAQLLGALLARHLRPRAVVERVARGLDGALRVFAAGLGDVGDLLAGRRGEGREGLARLRGRSTHR